MKNIIILSLLSLMINVKYSQENENTIKYTLEPNTQLNSIFIPQQGVLNLKSTTVNNNGNILTTVSASFLDLNLNEKWNKENAITYNISGKRTIETVSILSYEETYAIDPNGKYIYFIDQTNNADIKRIDLTNGDSKSITLDDSPRQKVKEYKCAIDDLNFYVIKRFESKQQKDKSEFEIFSINKNTLKVTKNIGITPSSRGELNTMKIQGWRMVGIDKNGFFMTTNMALKDKEKNRITRRVVKFNLKGEVIEDKFIIMGDNLLHKSHIGDIHYNEFGYGRFYTFSMHKNKEGKHLKFSEYNSDLELLWTKDHPTKVIPAQEDFLSEITQYNTTGVIMCLYQFDGDKYYSLTIDKTNKTQEFVEFNKEDKNEYKINQYKKYGIMQTYFYLIRENKEIINYVSSLEKKHGFALNTHVTILNNHIYIHVTPKSNMWGMPKALFIESSLFKK